MYEKLKLTDAGLKIKNLKFRSNEKHNDETF